MASADDVRILSLPEAAANLLVVGDHPLRDSLLFLARADEIEFHSIGADLAGRFPEMPIDPAHRRHSNDLGAPSPVNVCTESRS